MRYLTILLIVFPSLLWASEISTKDIIGEWGLTKVYEARTKKTQNYEGTMFYSFNEKSKVTIMAFGYPSEYDYSIKGSQLSVKEQTYTIKKVDESYLVLEMKGDVLYFDKMKEVKINKAQVTVKRISNFTSDGLQKIVTCSDSKSANIISMNNKVCIQKSLKIIECRSIAEWSTENAAEYFCSNL